MIPLNTAMLVSFFCVVIFVALPFIQEINAVSNIVRAVPLEKEYDFIIVGAGSAGAVVANRLSEDPNVKVLLLEAGGTNLTLSFYSKVPFLAPSLKNTSYEWPYMTEPQNYAAFAAPNRSVSIVTGKTLGGSSAVNYMFYVRGNKLDYDNWAAMGNRGWSYDEVLPLFKKSEDNTDPALAADVKYHSTKGNLMVSSYPKDYVIQFQETFLETCTLFGYPPGDYNAAIQSRSAIYQATITSNGQRASTAEAFIDPVVGRKNLHIIENALVLKVLFDESKRAYGVKYERFGVEYVAKASKEVILSCGAIKSPQLLMLSGVGPRKQLENFGIEVVADVEGVGENFHDHVGIGGLRWTFEKLDFISIKGSTSIGGLIQWVLFGTGEFSTVPGNGGIVFIQTQKTDKDKDFPDLQLYIGTASEFYPQYFTDLGPQSFAMVPFCVRPKSRGTVRLQSKNPHDNPLIDPNYLSNPDDVKVLVGGTKFAIKFVESEPYKKVGAKLYTKVFEDVCKGKKPFSEAYYECIARQFTSTNYHPVGTCKMGPSTDPMAVVDPSLKVRNVTGLRVIDASIMPAIASGNINAAAIMIGEKGSVLIKEDWKLKSEEELN